MTSILLLIEMKVISITYPQVFKFIKKQYASFLKEPPLLTANFLELPPYSIPEVLLIKNFQNKNKLYFHFTQQRILE